MSRRPWYVLVALCLAASGVSAAEGKKYALLVGVQTYDHKKLAEVPHAAQDMTALAAVLKPAGYDATVLSDAAGKTDKSLTPTRANIESALKALLTKTAKDDIVVVAFEGHGLRFTDKPKAYLCPRDAKPDEVTTLVSLDALAEKLGKSSAKVKVLLLDACRAAPDVEATGIDEVTLPAGVLGLLACSPGQHTADPKELDRGLFFHAVAEGLKGKGVNGDDAITFASLADYVVRTVPEDAKLAQNAKQTPKAYASGSGPSPQLALHPEAIPAAEWKDYLAVWSNGSTEPFLKKNAPGRYASWRKSAEAGSPRGMMLVADCHEFGIAAVGGKPNAKEAARWYARGAEHGNSFAMVGYGMCYRRGFGVEKDAKEAFRWFKTSAELGDASGMQMLGSCYATGAGIGKDQKEAVAWYRKSADRGFGQAYVSLGMCYLSGEGVKRDLKEALRIFRKGADGGNTDCMIFLGICNRDGLGTDENDKEAAVWFLKAAEAGNPSGMNLIGQCCLEGAGVDKDEKAGVAWFRKSAELDNAVGMLNLGKCYKDGTGVAKSRNEAIRWLRKASERGNSDAKELLSTLID